MDKELRKELQRDEVGEAVREARGFLTRSEVVKPALVVIGLLPQAGGVFAALKLLLVWLLVLLAAATVGQMMARVARRAGPSR